MVKFQPLPNLYGDKYWKKTYIGSVHGYITIYGNIIWEYDMDHTH